VCKNANLDSFLSAKKGIKNEEEQAIYLFTCYNSLKIADSDSEYKDSKEVMFTI